MELRVKPSDPQEPLAERLRAARHAKELTQAEAAQQLGVTPQTVHHWEKGTHPPQPRHRRAIRKFIEEAA